GRTPCYLLGKELPQAPLAYYPVALLIKWPIGFLAALLVLAVYVVKRRPPWSRLLWPLSLVAAFVVIVVFVARMGIGIRYLFPLVPSFSVVLGAVASDRDRGKPRSGASPRW